MEGDNKAIRRTEFESRREWEKSPFLINAQIRRSLCLKIVQTMETPTEATEKGGKAEAEAEEKNRLTRFLRPTAI